MAFPTETVYGLGADATNEAAVKQVYLAKGRPSDNPLIVHVTGEETVKAFAQPLSDKAEALIKAFWPGPLTLIFGATTREAVFCGNGWTQHGCFP
ncbi:TsaC protein (YrdC-Sua5 domain) required for threonylcarbamoyladenosine t(6)A37 modification in tRNA [Levilactobacillus brevis]|nr:TsaC protein (YrdC-Sua5 domain) required for threonylcarbamoyladenosine t(6)A37 modification in tRNA [Levilactobacillus brevis]